MNFSRAIKRKKLKEKRKSLNKQLRSALKHNDKLPSECTFCNSSLTKDANLDKWHLRIVGETIEVQCPDCNIIDT